MPTCPSPPPLLPARAGAHLNRSGVRRAGRARVSRMNRPADKENDYTVVFILNMIFIDDLYRLCSSV